MKKVLLTVVMSLMMCMGVYAQDYLNAPKANEKLLGILSVENAACMDNSATAARTCNTATKFRWYETLLQDAKRQYPEKIVDIRDLQVGAYSNDYKGALYYGAAVGKVVEIGASSPENQINKTLSQAMDKSFRNVREGSRVAIDMVTVSGGVSINREDLKDQIIDALLDKGYKVVAKDYLEKMYEEQEAQQSGIYNESTTVKTENFSAVGYYINVKVTETSLRVQVVNVSTGEYEGNATVNF